MPQSWVFWATVFASVPVYWLVPRRIRFFLLTGVSFGYLATLSFTSTAWLLFWTVLFYYLVPVAVGKRHGLGWLTPVLALAVCGFLAYFKYIPNLVAAMNPGPVERRLIIPLGISYYTFKLLHYLAECMRGTIKKPSFDQFACYLYLFPTFTAGPIERFDHFVKNCEDQWNLQTTVEGLTRIIHGLIKKFFIADMLLYPLFRGVTTGTELLVRLDALPAYKVWGFLVLGFWTGYVDFSAYSDIAIGISRLYGIRIMENFNFPFLARNIAEFWQRWHMSLAGWCRAQVYLPLIGWTRNPYLAVYSSMLVMGLWHSSALVRIMWGAYHATGLTVYWWWARYKRKRRLSFPDKWGLQYAGNLITIAFVSCGQAFLAVEGTHGPYEALRILARAFFLHLPG